MAGFFEPKKNHSQTTRDALTGSMKNKIKELIGKCEYCNIQKPINLLEVHHISEVASANGKSDKNTPGNLIVLCRDHHKLAHDGEITKATLKAKISKRSDKRKAELKAILRGRVKTTGERSNDPFTPPIFKPYKPGNFKF
jgi:5-methylcytosine-specific restriction endonuclease McrA